MKMNIEQCSLAIISKLPQILKPNQFVVAFFIINTMAVKKSDNIKMYRGELSDLCNMSERNITRITSALNELGVITKDLIGDDERLKTYNVYRLNWQFINDFFAKSGEITLIQTPKKSGEMNPDAKIVPLKELKNIRIKETKNKRNKETKKKDDEVGGWNPYDEETIETNNNHKELEDKIATNLKGIECKEALDIEKDELQGDLDFKRGELGDVMYRRLSSMLQNEYNKSLNLIEAETNVDDVSDLPF